MGNVRFGSKADILRFYPITPSAMAISVENKKKPWTRRQRVLTLAFGREPSIHHTL